MIAVFVTLDSPDLDDAVVRKVAAQAKATFQGMPGLRNKFFTLDEKQKQATNVYVWESESAAREFFPMNSWRESRDSTVFDPTSSSQRSSSSSTTRN